ncbi:MAG: SpoIID/LytB domain-containing protein [Cyanobacteriota bacterium]
MFRLNDKHPIFNRSVLWSVLLFSTSLFLPWVLAESFSKQAQSKTSSSTTVSPQPQSSPQPVPNQVSAEQEWHQRIASNSLSWQLSADSATDTTASKSADSKTNTPQAQAADSKTTTPQAQAAGSKTNTSQAKAADTKTKAPQPSKPTAQAQASQSSKTSKQQQSQSQSSQKSKAKAASSAHAQSVVEIRVAIAMKENSLAVGTSTPGEILNARGKAIAKLPANEAVNVLPDGPNIRVGKWVAPAGVWIKPSKGGFVFVNDRWYRGDVLLVSQGATLLAVNYVDLESYIASVVGSEVSPSWPMDSLKAQAIAARSYALVHYLRPANSLYDLGNTQRWQVYKGISSEWNTTRQAVEETRGVFLSYKGGVVESMYAASDDIVRNVFGGRGMSQNGALSLAQQGYNYQQILNNYYPGTSLAWMDAQSSDTD